MRKVLSAGFLLVTICAAGVCAHETRPAYFEVTERPGQWSVLWKFPTLGDPPISLHPLLGEVALESLPGTYAEVPGAVVREWSIHPLSSSLVGQRLAIQGLSATVTDVLIRVNFSDGTSVTRLLKPSDASWVIEPSRGSHVSAGGFFRLGVEHILTGIDHLMFVLLLLLIIEDRWVLVKTITAFTVAHSATLGIAALGYVSVATAPVEAMIALSILFLASELARHRMGSDGIAYSAPWIVAFSFGLLHGFGFAGALAQVGLPHADIPKALFFFNLGVEAGQLAFVAVVLSLILLARRWKAQWPAWSVRVPTYAIGALAAFLFIQRCALIIR